MEFGALQCVPKNPDCGNCIFNKSCLALKNKKVTQLPVKLKKLKVRHRFFNYLVFSDSTNKTIVRKRTEKGIWHNLYEFPLLETEKDDTIQNLLELIQNQNFVNNTIDTLELWNSETLIHKLSHQHLYIKFWKIKVNGTIENGIECKSASELPYPIVIYNFIEKEWF
jgi:A/G-specific adenine glycosylase